MTIRCLKLILSSVAAQVLIVPFTIVYLFCTWAVPVLYLEREIGRHALLHTIEDANAGAGYLVVLSQCLLIGAPYLIDRDRVLRLFAVAVYLCVTVAPVLYLLSIFVEGLYEDSFFPIVLEWFVMLGVCVTSLYIIALLSSPRQRSAGHGEENGRVAPG